MNNDRKFAIGVDLGATTVKTGIVESSGSISGQVSVESRADKGPDIVMNQIVSSVRQVLIDRDPGDCIGIGIGTPGVVSINDRMVRYPPNFAGWSSVDVSGSIRKVFHLPVEVENDANCAALAEARFGAGADFKDFIFVIWGTGVGGGIILDHKLFRGPGGGAGEIGHLSIDYKGAVCNCGGIGCIESYIGQRYLSARAKEKIKSAGDDIGGTISGLVNGDLDRIDPSVISRAAELGDGAAKNILEEAGTLLGAALASIMNVLDLEVAVIGGGISAAPDFVYESILSSARTRVLKPHKSGVRIVRAALGNNAGIIGAASLVL